jgi:Ca-activated chloride channel family protein
MTLNVQTDRTLVRAAGNSVRHVLISFAAPASRHTSTREPVNVSFVIDRSGSMGGSKIALAREAVVQALRMLKATDRFSVVAYDDQVEVLVSSTLASSEAVRNATAKVQELEARGSTDLCGGWLKGCEEVATHLQRDQIARCLLLSDGMANHGITDRDLLARHAEELRQRGIATSTIGVGADFDERTLTGISTAGGGHFYFVETPVQIPDCLTGELGEALEIVARDAAIMIRAGRGIDVTTLNQFPVRRESEDLVSVRLGDIASRQDVSIVLRLTFPAGPEGQSARAIFGVTDARGAIDERDTDLLWTFAGHSANDAQSRNVVVDRAAARLYAAQAKAEALELNREHLFEKAKERLRVTAQRIQQYAGSDAEIGAAVEELRERLVPYSRPMMGSRMKSEHFASTNASRMRSPSGKALRRPTS